MKSQISAFLEKTKLIFPHSIWRAHRKLSNFEFSHKMDISFKTTCNGCRQMNSTG